MRKCILGPWDIMGWWEHAFGTMVHYGNMYIGVVVHYVNMQYWAIGHYENMNYWGIMGAWILGHGTLQEHVFFSPFGTMGICIMWLIHIMGGVLLTCV